MGRTKQRRRIDRIRRLVKNDRYEAADRKATRWDKEGAAQAFNPADPNNAPSAAYTNYGNTPQHLSFGNMTAAALSNSEAGINPYAGTGYDPFNAHYTSSASHTASNKALGTQGMPTAEHGNYQPSNVLDNMRLPLPQVAGNRKSIDGPIVNPAKAQFVAHNTGMGAGQTEKLTQEQLKELLAKSKPLSSGYTPHGYQSQNTTSTNTKPHYLPDGSFNMTPNSTPEQDAEVQKKFDDTYMKPDSIIEGAITRSIGSGSPKMINKLRNVK